MTETFMKKNFFWRSSFWVKPWLKNQRQTSSFIKMRNYGKEMRSSLGNT